MVPYHQIEQVKDANPIEDVVGEELTLNGRGPRVRTKEHDSLEINTSTGLWYWHSKGIGGDVFNWIEHRRRCGFAEALQVLADRAGIELQRANGNAEQYAAQRARGDLLTAAGGYFHELLKMTPRALHYAHGRGWSDETIEAALLGFWDGRRQPLLQRLEAQGHDVTSDLAQALASMPPHNLIYTHVRAGRVEYLTTRSIEGKRHYNLPAAAAGRRRVYLNHVYHGRADHVVLVEGQADAVTLGQWGLAAVALCGVDADSRGHLVKALRRHGALYLALDQDAAGARGLEALAPQLGPTVRIVTWPGEAHDANDWLQAGGTSEECRELLASSPMYVMHLAQRIDEADPLQRDELRRDVAGLAANLDAITYEAQKSDLALALGTGVRVFNNMVKAAGKAEKASARDKRPVRESIGTTTSTAETHGYLYETIVEGQGAGLKTRLAVRTPEREIKVMDRLELEDEIIEPLCAGLDLVHKQAILLSPPPAPYTSLKTLAEEIQAFIHQYVDLDPAFERLSAFYVLYTWLYDVFPRAPYLRRLGAAQSGKTRWLQTMRWLVFRAYYISGLGSFASIFRDADKLRPTILVDEADFKEGTERAHDMNSLFNVGYDADYAGVSRLEAQPNGDYVTRFFNVYGPKIITMRHKFSDDATNTRCLTDPATGGGYMRKDIPLQIQQEPFRKRANELRAQLLHYRLTMHPGGWFNLGDTQARPDVPARLQEITLPLRLLFAEEKALIEEIDALQEAQAAELVAERSQTIAARVLEGLIRAYFMPDPELPAHERLAMKTIAHRANLVIDSENAGDDDDDGDDQQNAKRSRRRRKKLTPQGVARIVERDLHLTKDPDTTHRLVRVKWERKRIDALCRRFGLAELFAELAIAAHGREELEGAGAPAGDEEPAEPPVLL